MRTIEEIRADWDAIGALRGEKASSLWEIERTWWQDVPDLLAELAEKDDEIATREEQLKAAYAEIDNLKYRCSKAMDGIVLANNRTEYVAEKKDAEIDELRATVAHLREWCG